MKIKDQIKEIDADIADLLEQSGGVDTTLIKHLREEKRQLLEEQAEQKRGKRRER